MTSSERQSNVLGEFNRLVRRLMPFPQADRQWILETTSNFFAATDTGAGATPHPAAAPPDTPTNGADGLGEGEPALPQSGVAAGDGANATD